MDVSDDFDALIEPIFKEHLISERGNHRRDVVKFMVEWRFLALASVCECIKALWVVLLLVQLFVFFRKTLYVVLYLEKLEVLAINL